MTHPHATHEAPGRTAAANLGFQQSADRAMEDALVVLDGVRAAERRASSRPAVVAGLPRLRWSADVQSDPLRLALMPIGSWGHALLRPHGWLWLLVLGDDVYLRIPEEARADRIGGLRVVPREGSCIGWVAEVEEAAGDFFALDALNTRGRLLRVHLPADDLMRCYLVELLLRRAPSGRTPPALSVCLRATGERRRANHLVPRLLRDLAVGNRQHRARDRREHAPLQLGDPPAGRVLLQ